MPIVCIRRPLAGTEFLTEARGRVVQLRGFGFVFGARRAAVRGGDGAAGGGGAHVRAQCMARGAIVHVVLLVSV